MGTTRKSAQKMIEVVVKIPEVLYKPLREICRLREESISEHFVDDTIQDLDMEFQDNFLVAQKFGFDPWAGCYRDELEALVYGKEPEEAEPQEAEALTAAAG